MHHSRGDVCLLQAPPSSAQHLTYSCQPPARSWTGPQPSPTERGITIDLHCPVRYKAGIRYGKSDSAEEGWVRASHHLTLWFLPIHMVWRDTSQHHHPRQRSGGKLNTEAHRSPTEVLHQALWWVKLWCKDCQFSEMLASDRTSCVCIIIHFLINKSPKTIEFVVFLLGLSTV